jgi:hypothetical protein
VNDVVDWRIGAHPNLIETLNEVLGDGHWLFAREPSESGD